MPGARNGVPPDGGYGWVVVLASFTLQALTIGITYTFGVLFVVLLTEFNASESDTAWIGSIQPALLYFTGVLAGPLIRKFGWRAVAISGSILSSFGFLLSSFSPSIYLLYFTYGVMTGIGNGLMYVTSMVAVQHYFDKRRAMATGIAVSGSGVGTLAFGLITQSLLDALGWQWTLRIQAAIILLGVLCGALFRPLPQQPESSTEKEPEETTPIKSESYQNGMSVKDTDMGVKDTDIQVVDKGCCNIFKSILKETFDLSLFKNPSFILMCLTTVLFCFGYHVPYTYTPERAQRLGVESGSASFLVSIMGIANVASRLLFGWLGDKSETVRFYLAGVVLTLGGVVSICISLFTTYPLMVTYSVLFGAFTGCWASLFPCITVDLMGVHTIEKSLGQILAAGTLSFLFASPMSGWIISSTGNIDAPFWVVGSMEALGGLIFFSISCVRKRYPQYEPIQHEDEAQPRRRRYVSESFS